MGISKINDKEILRNEYHKYIAFFENLLPTCFNFDLR